MAHQRCFRLVIFLLFASFTLLPAYGQEAPLSGFDDYVNKAVREWEVPGLAIAISLTLVQGSGPSLVLFPKQ